MRAPTGAPRKYAAIISIILLRSWVCVCTCQATSYRSLADLTAGSAVEHTYRCEKHRGRDTSLVLCAPRAGSMLLARWLATKEAALPCCCLTVPLFLQILP
jgi:hypothetical protein